MLLAFVFLFAGLTFILGGYASTRVHTLRDFMIAGRSLPLWMSLPCVLTTWIGAETVLSISTTFVHDGIGRFSREPFGATACLLLVSFFFVRTFYQLRLGTIGDYYKVRYGRGVEWIASSSVVWASLGWTTAQFTALGIVIDALFPEVLLHQAILIGAMIVTGYTVFGGMWAISLTNLFHSVIIVGGLAVVAIVLGKEAGGTAAVLTFAREDGSLNLFPESTLAGWISYLGAVITIACGSISHQDVFQRVTSARDERTASIGTIAGAIGYFGMACVLIYIALAGQMLNQNTLSPAQLASASGFQQGLTSLVMHELPLAGRVLFLGALLSAILSTTSGTLLASASLLTENVLFPFTKHVDETERVWLARYILIAFSVITTSMALTSKGSLWQIVEGGARVPLIVAFVPLVCGIYWPKATTQGALLSVFFSVPTWIAAELYANQSSSELWSLIPPQFYGLAASFIGMVVGSLLPSLVPEKQTVPHIA